MRNTVTWIAVWTWFRHIVVFIVVHWNRGDWGNDPSPESHERLSGSCRVFLASGRVSRYSIASQPCVGVPPVVLWNSSWDLTLDWPVSVLLNVPSGTKGGTLGALTRAQYAACLYQVDWLICFPPWQCNCTTHVLRQAWAFMLMGMQTVGCGVYNYVKLRFSISQFVNWYPFMTPNLKFATQKVTKIVQCLKFATQSYKIDLYAKREQINFRILYSDANRVQHLLFFCWHNLCWFSLGMKLCSVDGNCSDTNCPKESELSLC